MSVAALVWTAGLKPDCCCCRRCSRQVHAAVLKGSNKDVVIKVIKPGVEDVLTTGEPSPSPQPHLQPPAFSQSRRSLEGNGCQAESTACLPFTRRRSPTCVPACLPAYLPALLELQTSTSFTSPPASSS